MRMVPTVEDRPSSTRLSTWVWASVSVSALVCSSVLLSISAKHLRKDAVAHGKRTVNPTAAPGCSVQAADWSLPVQELEDKVFELSRSKAQVLLQLRGTDRQMFRLDLGSELSQ